MDHDDEFEFHEWSYECGEAVSLIVTLFFRLGLLGHCSR